MGPVLPYAGVFVGMLFEGDLLLFGTTFLALRGTLDWKIALPVTLAGALIGDLGWYWAGTRLKPDGRPARALRKITRILDGRLERSPGKMLFLSKLTYGLHRPIQLRFGLERIGMLRFFRADLPATLVWFVAIIGLASLAHVTLLPVAHYLHFFEIALLLACVGFVLFESVVSRFVRRLLPKETKESAM